MEDEFIQNQERLKPQEEKNEVMKYPSGVYTSLEMTPLCGVQTLLRYNCSTSQGNVAAVNPLSGNVPYFIILLVKGRVLPLNGLMEVCNGNGRSHGSSACTNPLSTQ